MPNDVVSIEVLSNILDSDRKYRERRHPEWTENYLLFRSRVITNRLTQRQSMNVPYVKETIRTLVAKTATPPDIYFENLGNNKQQELLMNEYWLDSSKRNKLTLLDIVDRKQEGLYGRSYMKLTIEDGCVRFTILDPQDLLLDRFMKPWDIESARHVTHVGIYRTLTELERNPLYDKSAIAELRTFFQTKAGLLKAAENSQIVADRAERLRELGVPDVADPQVGETYVEVNETQIKVYDEKEEKDIVWIVATANGTQKLAEKKMLDVLGVNRFTICTWAGDIEATDIYSDGAADIARPLNQLANVRISQKTENGTLLNFGMQFYDSTQIGEWRPTGYTPAPFGFYPFPGNPNEKMKRVDIPEMSEVFEELDWYKSQIESATASSAIVKGEAEQQSQTATEVQVLAAQAAKRINAGQPIVEQYWEDIAELFAELVNANADLLEPATLHKRGTDDRFYPRTIKPAELHSSDGWKVRITSKAKKDAEALETIQKLKLAKEEFPMNAPLQKIVKTKVLAWLDLKPEEVKEVMDFDAQNPMPPIGPDGKPLLSAPVPVPVRKPAMSMAGGPSQM